MKFNQVRSYLGRVYDGIISLAYSAFEGTRGTNANLRRKLREVETSRQSQSDSLAVNERRIEELEHEVEVRDDRYKIVYSQLESAKLEADEQKARAIELEAMIDAAPPRHRSALVLARLALQGMAGSRGTYMRFELDRMGHILGCDGALDRLGYDKSLAGYGANRNIYFDLLHKSDVHEVRDAIKAAEGDKTVVGFRFVAGINYAGGNLIAPYLLRGRFSRDDEGRVRSVSVSMKRKSVGVKAGHSAEIEVINIPNDINSNPDLLGEVERQLEELRTRASEGYALTVGFEKLALVNDRVNGLLRDIFSPDNRVSVIRFADDRIYTAVRNLSVPREHLGIDDLRLIHTNESRRKSTGNLGVELA